MRMIREAWGKTDRDGGGVHPLAHHCMDVAAVFGRMMELPIIRNRLETAAKAPLSDVDRRRGPTRASAKACSSWRRSGTRKAAALKTRLPPPSRERLIEIWWTRPRTAWPRQSNDSRRSLPVSGNVYRPRGGQTRSTLR